MPEALLGRLKDVGALLEGHFQLTSGRHSDAFLLLARATEHPPLGAVIGQAVADLWRDASADVVVGPAMGGVILAYEVARTLGLRAMYTEKADGGAMALRRGFALEAGERVLMVEDAVSTGGSLQRAVEAVAATGAQVVGIGALADRSQGSLPFEVPFRAALRLKWAHWAPDDCPLCRKGVPLTHPKA